MDYRGKVLEVLVYIQDHLDEDLTVQSLSDLAGFSPYHFHRLFGGVVGESMMGFVRRLRLERAAFRLMHTRETVAVIAEEAGYSSPEPFSRRFRASFGVPPRTFRERHGQKWHLPSEFGLHYKSGEPNWSNTSIPKVSIENLPELKVVSHRYTGPYLEAQVAWLPLLEWAGREGIAIQPEHRIGICYDDPGLTEPQRLRYDACLVVKKKIDVPSPLFTQTVWGGPCAVYKHNGPYEGLESAYVDLLGQWLPQSQRTVRNLPCLEVYKVSTFDTEEPSDFQTLICLALLD